MKQQPGKIVSTKSGKIGRTFTAKGVMNGNVPVFLVERWSSLRPSQRLVMIGEID